MYSPQRGCDPRGESVPLFVDIFLRPTCVCPSQHFIDRGMTDRLFDCLDANGMSDHVHIRLMVTRGITVRGSMGAEK